MKTFLKYFLILFIAVMILSLIFTGGTVLLCFILATVFGAPLNQITVFLVEIILICLMGAGILVYIDRR